MKELTREIHKTEIYAVEAIDGERFYVNATDGSLETAKKNCEEYEKTAKAVITLRAYAFRIADTTSYDLTNGEGSEDYKIEIFKPTNPTQIKDLQMYLKMKGERYDKKFELNDECINKEIMVWFNYDEDGYTLETLETYMKSIKDSYYKEIEKYKGAKNDKNSV